MTQYQPLPTLSNQLLSREPIERPEFGSILHLDDPATRAAQSYAHSHVYTIRADDTLAYAQAAMKRDARHDTFVQNSDCQLIGLLSSSDTIGPKAIKMAAKHRTHHDELLAHTLMTKLDEIPCISEGVLKHAKVGNIVSTLNHHKSQFLLIASDQSNQQIVGLFNRLDLCERLKPEEAKSMEFVRVVPVN